MHAIRVYVHESVTAGDLGPDVPESLRREGAAMRDAVCADLERLAGVSVLRAREAGEEHFIRQVARCDWTLVIAPEIDDHLYRLSRRVIDNGGRLLGSLPSGIQCTSDKLATADHWRRSGVAHPRTKGLTSIDPAGLVAPCVIKPRHGAGSQAVCVLREPGDWDRAIHAARLECPHDELIVQPFMPGLAASVALLIGEQQITALLPARQHLSSDGRLRYLGGSLPLPPAWADRAERIARQAVAGIQGLRGYVGVDLVLGDDGVDYAIEINPRLTTSYLGLRQSCEQNIAGMMLCCVEGRPMEAPTWRHGEIRFVV
jgi:predicted ATP-grasp superfamily ATP-dependent carboligase